MESIDAFINANSKDPDAQVAFVEALFGEIGLEGKSPVLLTPRANTM